MSVLQWQSSGSEQGALMGGAISESDVRQVLEAGRAFIGQQAGQCVISLSHLEAANSVVLALLLDWVRTASHHQVELVFSDAPERLFRMAQVSGVDQLLGMVHPHKS